MDSHALHPLGFKLVGLSPLKAERKLEGLHLSKIVNFLQKDPCFFLYFARCQAPEIGGYGSLQAAGGVM